MPFLHAFARASRLATLACSSSVICAGRNAAFATYHGFFSYAFFHSDDLKTKPCAANTHLRIRSSFLQSVSPRSGMSFLQAVLNASPSLSTGVSTRNRHGSSHRAAITLGSIGGGGAVAEPPPLPLAALPLPLP